MYLTGLHNEPYVFLLYMLDLPESYYPIRCINLNTKSRPPSYKQHVTLLSTPSLGAHCYLSVSSPRRMIRPAGLGNRLFLVDIMIAYRVVCSDCTPSPDITVLYQYPRALWTDEHISIHV